MKIKKLIFIISDIAVISISWIFAYFLRFWLNPIFSKVINQFLPYLKFLPYIIIFSIPIYAFFGLYEERKTLSGLKNIEKIFKSTLISILVIMSLAFLLKELKIGRMVVFFFSLINVVFLSFTRFTLMKFYKEVPRKVLIVGKKKLLPLLYQKIKDMPGMEYDIVGILTSEMTEETGIGKAKYFGTLQNLEKVLKEIEIEEVFFALPDFSRENLLSLLFMCDKYGIEAKVITDLFGVLSGRTDLGELDGIPIYSFGLGKISSVSRILKRLMDVIFSIILLIISIPIWVIVPVLIKLDSSGPVFFIQKRVGERGRIFRMFKFRTMKWGVSPFSYAPRSPDDSRITRVGKVIRRTSLDEIPQLINVLKGEMSLVGPRPEMPFIVEKYKDWQRKRLEIKPGITGLWQIMGRKDLPLHENLEYDFYYIKNQSLLLDIIILLKTIPQVFRGKGAY